MPKVALLKFGQALRFEWTKRQALILQEEAKKLRQSIFYENGELYIPGRIRDLTQAWRNARAREDWDND
ncbi:MAG: hypothetical protein DRP08_01105 [Candidatus Aenigmatarchaeota archaeon]|nr:MAG: hypothetical protein DRP08_01105 [Candidatus Aenigmarchaeota archaeon]